MMYLVAGIRVSPCCACRFLLLYVGFLVRADAVARMPLWRSTPQFDKNQSAAEALPKISSISNGPDKLFQTLSAEVGNIQSQLQAMQNADTTLLTKQKAEYERELEVQRSELVKVEVLNKRMENETTKLRKVNAALRKKATTLAETCQKLRVDITQMENNVTNAIEFMQQSLNVSNTLLNADEVQVIAELNTKDLIMQKQMAQMKRLSSFGMLQIGSVRRNPERMRKASDRQGVAPINPLVQGMLSSLEDYNKQKAAREESLRVVFETRFRAGADQLHARRDEYKALFTNHEAEKLLQTRLIAAVQHLEKTHAQLLKQKHSVANYLARLGESNAVKETKA